MSSIEKHGTGCVPTAFRIVETTTSPIDPQGEARYLRELLRERNAFVEKLLNTVDELRKDMAALRDSLAGHEPLPPHKLEEGK